mmetsp:Transcript_3044/g.8026  ORF Transcript_3044/g.8026 Transcript_3044/m.8026 type:complete len:148 (-) Transcript_3044:488-931(-)
MGEPEPLAPQPEFVEAVVPAAASPRPEFMEPPPLRRKTPKAVRQVAFAPVLAVPLALAVPLDLAVPPVPPVPSVPSVRSIGTDGPPSPSLTFPSDTASDPELATCWLLGRGGPERLGVALGLGFGLVLAGALAMHFVRPLRVKQPAL